jgi:hypothetical protein
MAIAPTSPVRRQVSRAGQRLFLQALLDHLVWCWAGALLAAVVWFLVQPYLLGKAEDWVRWAVAAGFFVFATGLAIGLVWRRAPSQVEAALELDGRFQLRERVTTSLTLPADFEQSPVGQALIADANDRVAKLNVGSRFPVRLSWNALIVPGCAALLGLVSIFYNPDLSSAQATPPKPKEETKFVPAEQVRQDVNNLKKLTKAKWFENPKTDEERLLRREIERLLEAPEPKNEDQERERKQKIQEIKNNLQDRLNEMKDEQERKKAAQDQLKKLGERAKEQGEKGPADQVQNALNQGDPEKAAAEMKQLAEKLKNDKLDPKEREQLQKQLDDLKKELDNAADQKAQQDELQKDRDNLKKDEEQLNKDKNDLDKKKDELDKKKNDGKIDPKEAADQEQAIQKDKQALDQKQQALEQQQQKLDKKGAELKENGEKLQDLKEIAKDLDGAKKDLDKGDNKDAGQKLDAAADKLQKLGGNNDPDMKQLKEGLGGGGEPKDIARPFAKDGKTNSKDDKLKGDHDWNQGATKASEVSGGSFKKIKASEVQGHFEQARQSAGEVIERQQIPEDGAPFVKGYVENLGSGKKK